MRNTLLTSALVCTPIGAQLPQCCPKFQLDQPRAFLHRLAAWGEDGTRIRVRQQGAGNQGKVPNQGARSRNAEPRQLLRRGDQSFERPFAVAGMQGEHPARQHGYRRWTIAAGAAAGGRDGHEQDRFRHAAIHRFAVRRIGETGAAAADAGAGGKCHGQGKGHRHRRVRRCSTGGKHITCCQHRARFIGHNSAEKAADKTRRAFFRLVAPAEHGIGDRIDRVAAGHRQRADT